MFKKSLAAVAVLGAFAANSMAADVTLYGVADFGFIYTNVENVPADAATEGLRLDSGVNAGSRFGLKGTEDLGNGYKVSFNLENAFNADDGTLDGGRLFNREAIATISNDQWGSLTFGRTGGIGSAAGSFDVAFGIADAFDGGDGDILGLFTTTRIDNSVTYMSPAIGGFQVVAQYSFKMDNVEDSFGVAIDDQKEGHASANRYASFGVAGGVGALQLVAGYEQIMKSDTIDPGAENADAKVVTVGGNYDFGVAKLFAAAQYVENVPAEILHVDGLVIDGTAYHLGAQIPAAGGTVTTGLYWNDVESEGVGAEYLGGSVKYEYPLSARTTVYTSAGYAVQEIDGLDDIKTTQAYLGLTHTF